MNSFADFFQSFHFLRPEWLWALTLLPLLLWVVLRKHPSGFHSDWHKVIQPFLLPYLENRREGTGSARSALANSALCTVFVLITMALAGPTWEKKPVPVQSQQDNLVIVLDLSLSMFATDSKPNRITIAKRKLQDLLNYRTEGHTALVVYAGDAHIVAPLTDDIRTISAMLEPLDPFIMPALGSRVDLATKQAVALLKQSNATQGRIVLITDGIEPDDIGLVGKHLQDTAFTLDILSVGTQTGGPIDLPERGFLKDGNTIVMPVIDFDSLNTLARNHGGKHHNAVFDDRDLRGMGLTEVQNLSADNRSEPTDNTFDLWHDAGYWLVLIAIPIALIAWRQGALLIFLVVFALPSEQTMAEGFENAWKTPDQQGAELLESDPAAAAEKFQDPAWKGSAYYRAGDYENAAKVFSQIDTANGQYNYGNALAKSGDLSTALEAYAQVLEKQPDHANALAAKKLIEELLENQEKSDQQNDQSSDNSPPEDQDNQKSQQNDGAKGDGGQSGEQSSSEQNEQQQGQQGQQGQQENTDASQSREQQNKSGNTTKPEEAKDSHSNDATTSSGDTNNDADNQASEANAMAGRESDLSPEEKQAFEQWMRRVPDDPGGLLRRKFYQQHQQRQSNSEGKQERDQKIW